MFLVSQSFKRLQYSRLVSVFVIGFFSLASPTLVHADALCSVSPHALEEALDTSNHVSLYDSHNDGGFNVGSSYFSGLASGLSAPASVINPTDQRLYALLIDGRYDFKLDASMVSSLHPFISGGVGMASSGGSGTSSSLTNGNDVAPLVRVGGGVSYTMDPQWDLSLDYEAGRAALSAGDEVFTGRSQQSVDLQALNLGMHYSF